MPTIRQKQSSLNKIANFFSITRKILTKHEYMSSGSVPIRMNIIIRTFGTYERMINSLKQSHPYLEGMEEADVLEGVKPAPKPVEKKEAIKVASKVTVKKPEAPAPKKEVSDGKDL
jgi:hypothetical protein